MRALHRYGAVIKPTWLVLWEFSCPVCMRVCTSCRVTKTSPVTKICKFVKLARNYWLHVSQSNNASVFSAKGITHLQRRTTQTPFSCSRMRTNRQKEKGKDKESCAHLHNWLWWWRACSPFPAWWGICSLRSPEVSWDTFQTKMSRSSAHTYTQARDTVACQADYRTPFLLSLFSLFAFLLVFIKHFSPPPTLAQ